MGALFVTAALLAACSSLQGLQDGPVGGAAAPAVVETAEIPELPPVEAGTADPIPAEDVMGEGAEVSASDAGGSATDPPEATEPTLAEHYAGDHDSHGPLPEGVFRPEWLGTRPLQLGPDGEALPAPTPPELVVRRIPTIDLLPPPAPDQPYTATIDPLSDEVVARSTWTPECPVPREDLRYLTVSFWGFDDRPHTGEIIVHASWAEEVAGIFGQMFDARYPIEEMRIVAAAELEGTPTGDGNVTSGFVCRPTRGSTAWSQHAYGLAVDVNPFHNPYHRGQRILPELAGAYLDRDHVRPGMLDEGSIAVQAFDAIGWGWGGRWSSLIDWMHFSANGR